MFFIVRLPLLLEGVKGVVGRLCAGDASGVLFARMRFAVISTDNRDALLLCDATAIAAVAAAEPGLKGVRLRATSLIGTPCMLTLAVADNELLRAAAAAAVVVEGGELK